MVFHSGKPWFFAGGLVHFSLSVGAQVHAFSVTEKISSFSKFIFVVVNPNSALGR
jgi:hypothetical protein